LVYCHTYVVAVDDDSADIVVVVSLTKNILKLVVSISPPIRFSSNTKQR